MPFYQVKKRLGVDILSLSALQTSMTVFLLWAFKMQDSRAVNLLGTMASKGAMLYGPDLTGFSLTLPGFHSTPLRSLTFLEKPRTMPPSLCLFLRINNAINQDSFFRKCGLPMRDSWKQPKEAGRLPPSLTPHF